MFRGAPSDPQEYTANRIKVVYQRLVAAVSPRSRRSMAIARLQGVQNSCQTLCWGQGSRERKVALYFLFQNFVGTNFLDGEKAK